MSRVGKKPIAIPDKTEVNIAEGLVNVKGPLGELNLAYKPVVDIKIEDNNVILSPRDSKLETLALWGTYASYLGNMVEGVTKGYEKKLIIEGVGYRAEMKGDKLVLSIGFSHPVELPVDPKIKCLVEKDTITISGSDKEAVGQFAANVRARKKPEPYKGKGIRYAGEVIRRKEGKKAV
ncbi:50S ribosomal protein L6 [Candidatus Nomurabacteria bacterium]|nr:50S ribosomal protein L6 [Candidatus Nomurabacteria bacterium]